MYVGCRRKSPSRRIACLIVSADGRGRSAAQRSADRINLSRIQLCRSRDLSNMGEFTEIVQMNKMRDVTMLKCPCLCSTINVTCHISARRWQLPAPRPHDKKNDLSRLIRVHRVSAYFILAGPFLLNLWSTFSPAQAFSSALPLMDAENSGKTAS